MILTCEACNTKYLVDAEDIGVGGRDVRCAVCGAEWFAPYEPAPDAPDFPQNNAAAEAASEENVLIAEPVDDDLRLPVIASSAQDYEARLPMVRPRQEPGFGVIALLVGILITIGGALVLFGERERIVSFWPPAAHAYALVGLPVEMGGLVMRDVRLERTDDAVVLSGQVLNTSPFEVPAPPIKVTVRNIDGAALYFTVFTAQTGTLDPAGSKSFSHVLTDLPADAHSLEVDFTVSGAISGQAQ